MIIACDVVYRAVILLLIFYRVSEKMADDSPSNLPESDLSSLDTGRSEITTSRTEKEDSSSESDDDKGTDIESDSDDEAFDKAMFALLDSAPDVEQGMELVWSANKRLFYRSIRS